MSNTMDAGAVNASTARTEVSTAALTAYRLSSWLKSPRPYLMLVGFAAVLSFWYLAVEVWKLPRFQDMPGLTEVVTDGSAKSLTMGCRYIHRNIINISV